MSEKEHASAATARQLQVELDSAKAELAQSEATLDKLQRQKAAEMEHVEQRVKAAIQRKDDTINTLKAQLADANASMRSTEQMLAGANDGSWN
jgi:chromosome segregation ATPase